MIMNKEMRVEGLDAMRDAIKRDSDLNIIRDIVTNKTCNTSLYTTLASVREYP